MQSFQVWRLDQSALHVLDLLCELGRREHRQIDGAAHTLVLRDARHLADSSGVSVDGHGSEPAAQVEVEVDEIGHLLGLDERDCKTRAARTRGTAGAVHE